MGALWHGFADMGAVERDGAFVVARGAGAYVWDRAGNRYLDATAGLWFTNVGHGLARDRRRGRGAAVRTGALLQLR